jgi:outer membrane autotransporter protein
MRTPEQSRTRYAGVSEPRGQFWCPFQLRRAVCIAGLALPVVLPSSVWAVQLVVSGTSAPAAGNTYKSAGNGRTGSAIVVSGASARLTGTNLVASATGTSADAIYASTGGIAALTGGQLSSTAGDANAYAIFATSSARVTTNGTSIFTSGTQGADAVVASNSGSVEVDGGIVNVTRTTGTDPVIALRAFNAGATVTANNVTVSTSGAMTRGAAAQQGGSIVISGGSISAAGDASYGVYADRLGVSSGTAQLTDVSITTSGAAANAIHAISGGVVSISGSLNVHTDGTASEGIHAGIGSNVSGSGTFNITTTGGAAFAVSASGAGSVVNLTETGGGQISTSGTGAHALRSADGASLTLDGGNVDAAGSNAAAIAVRAGSASISNTSLASANSFGALVVGNGSLSLSNSHLVGQSHGIDILAASPLFGVGQVDVVDSVSAPDQALSQPVAVAAAALPSPSNVVSIQGGRIDATTGDTVHVEGAVAAVSFSDNATASTGSGALLRAISAGSRGSNVSLTIDNSVLAGDVIVDSISTVGTTLQNAAQLTGAVLPAAGGVANMSLQGDSVWNVTASSTVNTLSNDSSLVALSAPAGGAFKTLTVQGNYAGNNGTVRLNTFLNEGGALANQRTDRLLVAGSASGTTSLDVVPTADSLGGITSPTGVINASEGISVVQVAGPSTQGAFTLPGGYVTAVDSPYQYRLYAYGPSSVHGAADPSQALAGNASGFWDYRLQTAYVTPDGPVDPDQASSGAVPGPEVVPTDARLAVAPQVAAYVTAPAAVLFAGMFDLDTLHRRLGEIRDDRDLNRDGGPGEMFFRAYGGNFNYSTNQGFKDYGYNATGDYTAIQLGGNVFKRYTDTGIWRFGLAGSLGWLHFEPEAVDGPASSRSTTYRLSSYATYQSQTGWYVDGILSVGWFDGEVDTQARGDTMKLRGNDYATSIEAGYPFGIGAGLNLEPQLQLVGQHVSFKNATDADGLPVNIGSQNQLIGRLGARLTRPFDVDKGRVTPYAAVDLLHAFTDGTNVQVGDASFVAGKYGDAVQLSLGINGTMNQRLSAYGRVSWQQALGNAGFRAWLFNAGVRYLF